MAEGDYNEDNNISYIVLYAPEDGQPDSGTTVPDHSVPNPDAGNTEAAPKAGLSITAVSKKIAAGKGKTVTITAMSTDGTKKKAKVKIRIR